MFKELQKKLSIEQKNKTIFDIVLYGSCVKGKSKPSDIDIAVIFRSGSLKDRLEYLQKIKRTITTSQKIDIKAILLEELFRPEFFARSGIFLEGISLFDGKPFAEKIGYTSSALFKYSLEDKSHVQKVKLNYILKGRNSSGMIEKLKGTHLAPGVIEIPIAHALEFEEVLQKQEVQFQRKNILIQK